jgi:type II secretory pathway pseudopilin PulG
MVVISIVGLVSGVVLASFSGGIRVWESASILTHIEQESYFAAESIRRDLASTFPFYDLGVKGEEGHVSFPGLIPWVDDESASGLRVGTVKYLHNQAEGELYRLIWPYPGLEEDASSELIAEGVEAVRFSYLKPGADPEDGWVGSWQTATNFPVAVAVEMTVGHKGQQLVIRREVPLMEGLWRED